MLPDATTQRMIEELKTLLGELEAGLVPSNIALEEEIRRRVARDIERGL